MCFSSHISRVPDLQGVQGRLLAKVTTCWWQCGTTSKDFGSIIPISRNSWQTLLNRRITYLFCNPVWICKCLKKHCFSLSIRHFRPIALLRCRREYFGCGPFPVTVTTRIATFLVGNPYKPSFATVTGRGPHPRNTFLFFPHFSHIFLGAGAVGIFVHVGESYIASGLRGCGNQHCRCTSLHFATAMDESSWVVSPSICIGGTSSMGRLLVVTRSLLQWIFAHGKWCLVLDARSLKLQSHLRDHFDVFFQSYTSDQAFFFEAFFW